MTIFIQTEKPVYHQSQIGKKNKSNSSSFSDFLKKKIVSAGV